ncbi:MAG: non-canonical purine NTP pyrophosphatase [Thermomicrobiales bacterium]|nr:non-canonical purine NTP pyrophosphatase [Thermomicrobiales bacterium]
MNRRRILIATTNRGKAQEFAELLPFDAELLTLRDLGIDPPDEPGATFVENATIKALAGNAASGLITIADDSGICVDALVGAPGIRSARFAGEDATDALNRHLLLQRLDGLPLDQRAAHFEAAIVVAYNNVVVSIGIGRTDGRINPYERGEHGFGYDSIFLLPDGRTMAELPATMKNEISHRSKATAQVIPALLRLIDDLAANATG